MKRALTVLFLLLVAGTASAQTSTYRWVDEDGVVHYSDSPNPAATNPEKDRFQIPEANVVQTRRPASSARATTPRSAGGDDDAPVMGTYRSLTIVNPASDQMLWNIGGQLTVSVQAEPALQPGHGVIVILDGKPMQDTPVASSTIPLSEVWRGTHTLRAVVRGPEGRDLISSDTITFYVQQTTIN